MKEALARALNTILMWNLFLVLASFGWFAIALGGHSLDLNLGLEVWYSLWEPLFMPAIGILMAGALISGLTGWVSNKLSAFGDRG
ncbi:MAG: hypothetical protein AAF728_09050 [Cyanobacteria bacterium P01_D01_bin.128]|mgnify:CR=1 FL=1